jgi:hypothetical protein
MGRSLASLDDRYRLEDGEVLLSGVQALARGAPLATPSFLIAAEQARGLGRC